MAYLSRAKRFGRAMEGIQGAINALNDVLAVLGEGAKGASFQEKFDLAGNELSDVATGVEELKDELQEWLDNLPENLQSSSKADALQEAIDALESIQDQLTDAEDEVESMNRQTDLDDGELTSVIEDVVSNLENLQMEDVDFPGMFS